MGRHVLLVGAGVIAHRVHLPQLLRSPLVSRVSVADLDADTAARAAAAFGLEVHSGELESSPADLVLICTPPQTHAEIAIRCLRAGKDVVVEKPLALTTHDAYSVVAAALQAGRRVRLCHTPRYRPDVQLLTRLARDGELGRLRRVAVRWTRRDGVPATAGARSAGVLWDLGSHLVDLVAGMVSGRLLGTAYAVTHTMTSPGAQLADWYGGGSAPVEAAQAPFPAGFCGSVVLDDGFVADVSAAWASDIDGDLVEAEVTGSTARVTLRALFGLSPDRHRLSGPSLERIDLQTGDRQVLLAGQLADPEEYAAQCAATLDSTVDPGPGLAQAVRTVEICAALAESTRTGRAVRIVSAGGSPS